MNINIDNISIDIYIYLDQHYLSSMKDNLDVRRHFLMIAQQRLNIEKIQYKDNLLIYQENCRIDQINQQNLNKYRLFMMKEIFQEFYVIQRIPTHQLSKEFSSSSTNLTYLHYSISGYELPNSKFSGLDSEKIATALGFTAHLVTLLAHWFNIPLRYPLSPIGSRCTIRDQVSIHTLPPE